MFINPGDVADGVLVNALWAVGQMVVRPRASHRVASELDVVGWMDTETLTMDDLPAAKLGLPEMAEADAAGLQRALQRDEVQGALQALLAARLTNAPETDAARAREGVRLALRGERYAQQLGDYYDRKIGDLVGDLEGRVGFAGLSQVRNEAYNSRIVALLGAIERQVTALADSGRGSEAEADFLDRYRRQVRARHGKLEPPDFERRRRVPVEEIYVSTSIYAYRDNRVDFGWMPVGRSDLNVMDMVTRLDRTVLLGDPGGGKTTVAKVIANYFASDLTGKVPFLVTLREYAAKEPPELSVVGHIELMLETLYQTRAPDGLVERLLLTGRALVVFDGLDELLDTSRRREVSDRVEQFCSAYQLTRVLVTSRVVGYDQAQLDDDQFKCYRLGGFGEAEVAEYVQKWFTVQESVTPAEAKNESQAFLVESSGAPDLRYNPLMLSLMCILYRGAGSLPRDRAGIYGRCAELLLGKWDESRRIHRELQAGHLVEPAIRYLAWWLFSSGDSGGAVTERALVDEVGKYLHGRGFESREQARTAAREFVEFCSGRMWVLSNTGTTGDGERLYSFTHRTFLEYFAAAHLATVSDTPEDLARALAPHVSSAKGWNLVSELAMQIKDRSSDRGADRIYTALLNPVLVRKDSGALLAFLAECLGSVWPSPAVLRALSRAMVDYRVTRESILVRSHPLLLLLRNTDAYDHLIADEINCRIAAMVTSKDKEARLEGLLLVLEIGLDGASPFWSWWSVEQASRYAAEIVAEATYSNRLRTPALDAHVISLEQALEMPGGLGALMGFYPALLTVFVRTPYPLSLYYNLVSLSRQPASRTCTSEDAISKFALMGRYLASNPRLPWARAVSTFSHTRADVTSELKAIKGLLGNYSESEAAFSGLGFAAVYAMDEEIDGAVRRGSSSRVLTSFPMPPGFKELFGDWIKGKVDFVEIVEKKGGRGADCRHHSE